MLRNWKSVWAAPASVVTGTRLALGLIFWNTFVVTAVTPKATLTINRPNAIRATDITSCSTSFVSRNLLDISSSLTGYYIKQLIKPIPLLIDVFKNPPPEKPRGSIHSGSQIFHKSEEEVISRSCGLVGFLKFLAYFDKGFGCH
jgi:hypothetical protein